MEKAGLDIFRRKMNRKQASRENRSLSKILRERRSKEAGGVLRKALQQNKAKQTLRRRMFEFSIKNKKTGEVIRQADVDCIIFAYHEAGEHPGKIEVGKAAQCGADILAYTAIGARDAAKEAEEEISALLGKTGRKKLAAFMREGGQPGTSAPEANKGGKEDGKDTM